MTRSGSDPRTVLTLDAGGSKLAFSAFRDGAEIVEPITRPMPADELGACLAAIVAGFEEVRAKVDGSVVALSFAFPGPAEYADGIIGDLGNIPAFRGGVPLGPMLEARFGIPVFINNDGDLFTLGEWIGGLLPEVNAALESAGSHKRYRNLIGFTFGTGLGGGFVHAGRLYRGDNSAAGEVWLLRNKVTRESFVEEGVSSRAVRRVFAQTAGIPLDEAPRPREIEAIALGKSPGNVAAALEAYRALGEVAGDAIANVLTILDGLVVLGGGLSGAAPLFLPAIMRELDGKMRKVGGGQVNRLELVAFNWEDEAEREAFLAGDPRIVTVPGSGRSIPYDPMKRTAIGVTRLGTSRATALGAWAFALYALDARR